MSRPETSELVGRRVNDVAAMLGKSRSAAKAWLNQNGFRISDEIVRQPKSANELQHEIATRIAAAPPSAPCFLCGAARGCEHRERM
ncbi:hypothetical protein SAMN05192583_0584 [Sphingomonas gellani]|uniref:Uncharacterized protein n=1 Tax=Sphingomonas gellani TaxID=1166340 RepID=A0A1H7Z854_9SPHN|nr:hypothetical protein [Sphingomonas gellani]SEM54772.1 hypothetical protein SAMN05192583_0584 [Sphingomonas gellani]